MRPAIQVTVAASTLLGLDEQPGELAGHGPIPASVARRLAADPTGTWRRLLTDPATNTLLDYGRTTYRPPKDLTDHVIARDQTCTFPGCARKPTTATSTTAPPSTTAGRPAPKTCKHSADGTTASNTKPAGHSTQRRRQLPLDQPHTAHLPITTTRPPA